MAKNVALLLLLGLLGVAAQGQREPRQAPAKCQLAGQVINVTTGKPVPGVLIYIFAVPQYPFSFTAGGIAKTDASGHFETRLMDARRYRVQGWRYDNIQHCYVSSTMMHGPDAIFSLRTGEKLTGLEFHVESRGEIDGRVLDENGHPPVVPVTVRAVKVEYSFAGDGKKYLQPLRMVQTDKQGAYQLSGLPPDHYLIEVIRAGELQFSANGPFLPRGLGLPSQAPRLPGLQVFYTDSLNPAAAKEVAVGPGAKVEGINFRFPKIRRFSVTGSATSKIRGGGPYMTMLILRRNAYYTSHSVGASMFLEPAGAFDLHDISPGDYTILAVQRVGNTPYSLGILSFVNSTTVAAGVADIEVSRQNVTGANVKMSPPVRRLAGQLVVQGNAPIPAGKVSIRLMGESGEAKLGAEPLFHVNPDGSFVMKNLWPGLYRVRLRSAIPRMYIESVRMGTQDALAHPLEIRPGTTPGPVEVNVGLNPAALSGTVFGANGRPIQGATVVLVPEPALRDAPELYRSVVTDQNDRFLMQDIRPGKYTVYAWRMIDQGAWFDPAVMKAASGLGVAIELKQGEKKKVQLRAIPVSDTPPVEP